MCCNLSVTGAANRERYALHSGPVHAKRNSTRPTLGCWKWLRWVTDATASDVYLDGGPGEAAQLLDVLSFLSDDGPDGLRWDVHVDRLLLRSLDAQTPRTDVYLYTTGTAACF